MQAAKCAAAAAAAVLVTQEASRGQSETQSLLHTLHRSCYYLAEADAMFQVYVLKAVEACKNCRDAATTVMDNSRRADFESQAKGRPYVMLH